MSNLQNLSPYQKLYFNWGITRLQGEEAVCVTFTLQELLDGREIHHVTVNGDEGWLKAQNGVVDSSWAMRGGPRHGKQVDLKPWIETLRTNGHDYDPKDDCDI